ncbi:MAG: CCA tRNA nucleotidyltransferase [Hyphomicrobiaceae bacterium]
MAPSPATSTPHPLLAAAAWLRAPETRRVLNALEASGATARVVGGAVRNTLLARPVSDIDIATDATPDEVMAAARAAGLEVVATGLKHGTVTVIAGHRPFEVTTLRADVETDGRHATVAFNRDWAGDARRRDFTINALYCDAEGRLFDHCGGLADLAARRVRFIGDAHQRIREDFLRILRFFRFSAEYSGGSMDPEGLAACIDERGGLARLSAERVHAELLKLLSADAAPQTLAAMQAGGLLRPLFDHDGDVATVARLFEIKARIPDGHTAGSDRTLVERLIPLAALACVAPVDATRLMGKLRLSRHEHETLAALDRTAAAFAAATARDQPAASPSDRDIGIAVYRRGAAVAAGAVLLAWARSPSATDAPHWRRSFDLARHAVRPVLPFSGGDVVALGVAPGPEVGRALERFEAWWIAAGFPADAALLRNALRRAVMVSEM